MQTFGDRDRDFSSNTCGGNYWRWLVMLSCVQRVNCKWITVDDIRCHQ